MSSPHATSSAWEAERLITVFHFVSAVGKNATDRAVAPADWLVRRLDFGSNKDNRKFVPFLCGSFLPVDSEMKERSSTDYADYSDLF